jgi:hypothetical protein
VARISFSQCFILRTLEPTHCVGGPRIAWGYLTAPSHSPHQFPTQRGFGRRKPRKTPKNIAASCGQPIDRATNSKSVTQPLQPLQPQRLYIEAVSYLSMNPGLILGILGAIGIPTSIAIPSPAQSQNVSFASRPFRLSPLFQFSPSLPWSSIPTSLASMKISVLSGTRTPTSQPCVAMGDGAAWVPNRVRVGRPTDRISGRMSRTPLNV